jgi:ribosomal protein L37AE/L43A
MSKNLSQIVAEFFAKPTGGEDESSRVQRLGDEIRRVVASEDTMVGKFRGLLASFREIIPDEKQRYHAAFKALSTTAKLSRQEILRAISGQLEELTILEKGLMPAQSAWRDELKALEARSQELKNEMTKLRERLAQLENEEKAIQAGMAARGKELDLAEKSIRELLATIREEIISLNKKVEELPAEGPAVQPVPPAPQPASPGTQPLPKAPAESPAVQPVSAAPQPASPGTQPPPKAPAEAPAAQPVPPKDPVKTGGPGEKKQGGEQKIEIQTASPAEETQWQKKCPMCGGPLNLLELENMWQCYTCAYEASLDDIQGAGTPSPAGSPASLPSDEGRGTEKGPSPSADHAPTKKKTCPSCRKKMFWYPQNKAWRCPSCNYERRI